MPNIEVRKIANWWEYTAEEVEDAWRYTALAEWWLAWRQDLLDQVMAGLLIDDGVVHAPMNPIHSAWREHWMPDLRSGTATLLPECALQARHG